MNSLLISLQAAQPATGNGWSFWVMMIAVFAVMYFFMIRPQNKKQKELQKFQNSLTEGQEVITTSGIHGIIKQADPAQSFITLEIATGVKIKIERTAIVQGSVK